MFQFARKFFLFLDIFWSKELSSSFFNRCSTNPPLGGGWFSLPSFDNEAFINNVTINVRSDGNNLLPCA